MVLEEILLIPGNEFNLMAFTVINTIVCISIDLLILLSKLTNYKIKCPFKMQFKNFKGFPESTDLS